LQEAIADNSRYDAFDLVAAALAGRLDQAFKVLRGLRAEAAEPVMILWAILRELRLACRLSWRSGRGEALEALFAEHHIWQARQGPLRDALKRHTTTGLWALLLLAGRAERGIKGMGERSVIVRGICAEPRIPEPSSSGCVTERRRVYFRSMSSRPISRRGAYELVLPRRSRPGPLSLLLPV
jgi:hypothetical protein